MEYNRFRDILDRQIFECSKSKLLENLAKYPHRYIGLFRPTKPKAKILQNLLQSHEIRFGDALEILFEGYFEEIGYTLLPKQFTVDGEQLNLDQLFQDRSSIVFIEQKVRDDHDSTKKRGQVDNFEKKLNILRKKYSEKQLKCFMYFIDDSLRKNRRYYFDRLSQMSEDYKIPICLCYGSELWIALNHNEIWSEVLKHLEQWKTSIPDMPSINFDEDANSTFNELRDIDVSIYRSLFNNVDICNEILPIIFPHNKTLKLLYSHFSVLGKEQAIYQSLSNKLKVYLKI